MPYYTIKSLDNTISWVSGQAWNAHWNSNAWQIEYVKANSDTCKEIEIKEEDIADILGGEENDK